MRMMHCIAHTNLRDLVIIGAVRPAYILAHDGTQTRNEQSSDSTAADVATSQATKWHDYSPTKSECDRQGDSN
jgi:hypothetical protein